MQQHLQVREAAMQKNGPPSSAPGVPLRHVSLSFDQCKSIRSRIVYGPKELRLDGVCQLGFQPSQFVKLVGKSGCLWMPSVRNHTIVGSAILAQPTVRARWGSVSNKARSGYHQEGSWRGCARGMTAIEEWLS